MKDSFDLYRKEFIGKSVEVKGKKITGKIIYETRSSFLLKIKEGKKMIMKSNNKFCIGTNSNKVEIDGNIIIMRPEDRIKAKWK